MSLDAEVFRSRAIQCRDVADGTKDIDAQRELRELANDLNEEAGTFDAEEVAKTNPVRQTMTVESANGALATVRVFLLLRSPPESEEKFVREARAKVMPTP